MTVEGFLNGLIEKQKLSDEEREILTSRRKEVEDLLRDKFGSSPVIKYGGSKAKGTMIQESYDLDVVCYHQHDCTDTLKDLYKTTAEKLREKYIVDEKRSAIRVIRGLESNDEINYHVDVVPGKFVDENKGDCYLHQNVPDKERLKTNIKTHICYIKDSGLIDVIKLAKLWKIRWKLEFKTFVLEVFIVEKVKNEGSLKLKFKSFLENVVESIEACKLVDPANSNNVVSDIMETFEKINIKNQAENSLAKLIDDNIEEWHDIFDEPIELNEEGLEKSNELVLYDHSHAVVPTWPRLPGFWVSVSASVYLDNGNSNKIFLSGLSSDSRGLPKQLWIEFKADTDIPRPFDVYWQIVNTGPEAKQHDKGLRGDLESSTSLTKWEYTSYFGKHYVLCHIVKNGHVVTSKPFYINISSKIFSKRRSRFKGIR